MPGRNLNDTERRLLQRWNAGYGPSLRSVEVAGSGLRGVQNITVDFRYPLTVIAGKNGVGKSTILACGACAYRNNGNFRTLLLEKQYFNFSDFFLTGWGDAPLQGATVRWTYREADRTITIVQADKGQSRWGGQLRRRPSREVEVVGTVRAIHPCEFRVLRNHFWPAAQVAVAPLTPDEQTVVRRVLDRQYDVLQLAQSGRYGLHHLSADGNQYSGFNAGSGEDITCFLARVLQRVPSNSLVLIEEVETGLHPAAQRMLAAHLLDLCWQKRIQVICTTHSAEILGAVPSEARVLLSRRAGQVRVQYEPTVDEVTSDLIASPVAEMAVCVEDRTARSILLESLPANVRTRIRVIRCGSWEDVLRQMGAFCLDPALGHVVGLLDGDRNGQAAEHETAFARCFGGALTQVQRDWLADRIQFLPGNVPPEAWLWSLGNNDDFRNVLAAETNADVVQIIDMFTGPVPADVHNLPFILSQRLGIEEGRALVALALAAARSQQASLGPLTQYISQRLGLI